MLSIIYFYYNYINYDENYSVLETPILLRVLNLRSRTYRCENQDLVSRIHLIYGIKMVIGVANQITFSHLWCENQDLVSRIHLIYGIKMVIGVANQITFSHLWCETQDLVSRIHLIYGIKIGSIIMSGDNVILRPNSTIIIIENYN
jgi:hypothetical protein